MDQEYKQIAHAERTVDIYGGDSCEEHIPRWRACFDGDMGDSDDTFPLTLDPKSFPPGTKVMIQVPVCPECGMDAGFCETSDCEFNWRQWAEDRYA